MPKPQKVEDAPAVEEVRPRRRRGSRWLTAIGVVLLSVGLISLGLIGWDYLSTEMTAEKEIQVTRQEVQKTWQQAEGEAVSTIPGQAFALMRIPYLGPTWEMPIVVGADVSEIDRGIGWFPESAKPGQIGNFAVAGHRGINNLPFSKLPEVPAGEKVIVETRDAIYTYVLDNSANDLKVLDTELWVLDPDPINKSQKATKAMITLVTCYNLVRSPDRAIAFGHLVDTKIKEKK